jgi:glycerophosphoryl diester phosphodiesterase
VVDVLAQPDAGAVNNPSDMERLIEMGVDGIITDYPDRLRRAMSTKGLPLP